MTATRIALADLRDSWTAWLSVSLTFLVTSTCTALGALCLVSSLAARDTIGKMNGTSLAALAGMNTIVCSLVALAVVGSSTGLVVTARRGAIARLLLAGASPGQVVRVLMVQLAAVTLTCTVVGAALAVALQPTILRVVAEDRDMPVPAATVPVAVLAGATLYCLAVALLGGLRQARRATRTPAVDALRDASDGVVRRTSGWRRAGRWAGFVACFAVIGFMLAGCAAGVSDMSDSDAFTNIGQSSAFAIPIAGLAFALVAPSIAGPLTRAWSRLIPAPGRTWKPVWHLARSVVGARTDRLAKSVVPLMFAIGMLVGMTAFSDSLVATFERLGRNDLEGTSAISTFSILGLPLAIAVAGSVGNLVMMSRQRDAELALDGIIGATPAQQRLLPVVEATLIVGTAAILGVIIALIGNAALVWGLGQFIDDVAFSVPLGMLAAILASCWVVTVAATVLPSLPSLRRPAPKVIARLVAS